MTAMNIDKKLKRKRIWRSVVTTLAAIVVFITTYALIIPAITWEKTLICELEEHVHTDNCYNSKGELKCGMEEHKHTADCFDAPKAAEKLYICGYAEHTHTDDCYFADGTLKCTMQEHQHISACKNNARTIVSASTPRGAAAVISGVLPENARAEITEIYLSEGDLVYYFGADKAAIMADYAAYDIKIMVDGEEWQPDETVSVTIRNVGLETVAENCLGVAHVEDGTGSVTDVEVQMSEEGGVAFNTDGFSTYIVYLQRGIVFNRSGLSVVTGKNYDPELGVKLDYVVDCVLDINGDLRGRSDDIDRIYTDTPNVDVTWESGYLKFLINGDIPLPFTLTFEFKQPYVNRSTQVYIYDYDADTEIDMDWSAYWNDGDVTLSVECDAIPGTQIALRKSLIGTINVWTTNTVTKYYNDTDIIGTKYKISESTDTFFRGNGGYSDDPDKVIFDLVISDSVSEKSIRIASGFEKILDRIEMPDTQTVPFSEWSRYAYYETVDDMLEGYEQYRNGDDPATVLPRLTVAECTWYDDHWKWYARLEGNIVAYDYDFVYGFKRPDDMVPLERTLGHKDGEDYAIGGAQFSPSHYWIQSEIHLSDDTIPEFDEYPLYLRIDINDHAGNRIDRYTLAYSDFLRFLAGADAASWIETVYGDDLTMHEMLEAYKAYRNRESSGTVTSSVSWENGSAVVHITVEGSSTNSSDYSLDYGYYTESYNQNRFLDVPFDQVTCSGTKIEFDYVLSKDTVPADTFAYLRLNKPDGKVYSIEDELSVTVDGLPSLLDLIPMPAGQSEPFSAWYESYIGFKDTTYCKDLNKEWVDTVESYLSAYERYYNGERADRVDRQYGVDVVWNDLYRMADLVILAPDETGWNLPNGKNYLQYKNASGEWVDITLLNEILFDPADSAENNGWQCWTGNSPISALKEEKDKIHGLDHLTDEQLNSYITEGYRPAYIWNIASYSYNVVPQAVRGLRIKNVKDDDTEEVIDTFSFILLDDENADMAGENYSVSDLLEFIDVDVSGFDYGTGIDDFSSWLANCYVGKEDYNSPSAPVTKKDFAIAFHYFYSGKNAEEELAELDEQPPYSDFADHKIQDPKLTKQIDYLGDSGITGMDDLYRLYLSLQLIPEPMDLVLVIDQSGSMANDMEGHTKFSTIGGTAESSDIEDFVWNDYGGDYEFTYKDGNIYATYEDEDEFDDGIDIQALVKYFDPDDFDFEWNDDEGCFVYEDEDGFIYCAGDDGDDGVDTSSIDVFYEQIDLYNYNNWIGCGCYDDDNEKYRIEFYEYLNSDYSGTSREAALLEFLNGKNADHSDGFITAFRNANVNNNLAVLTFSDDCSESRIIMPWTSTDLSVHPDQPYGATNYTAALDIAFDVLAQMSGSQNKQVMIFLSDGVPTLAYSDGQMQHSYAYDNVIGTGDDGTAASRPMSTLADMVASYIDCAYSELNAGSVDRSFFMTGLSTYSSDWSDDDGNYYTQRPWWQLAKKPGDAGYPLIIDGSNVEINLPGIPYMGGPFTNGGSDFRAWYEGSWSVWTDEQKGTWISNPENVSYGMTYDVFYLTEHAFLDFRRANPDVAVYSIAFSDFPNMASGRKSTEVLEYMASDVGENGSGRFYECTVSEDLVNIVLDIAMISNVSITDPLSDYVDLADEPKLEITMTLGDESDAVTYTLYAYDEIADKYDFTDDGRHYLDTTATKFDADGTLHVVFDPSVRFNQEFYCEVSFDVAVNDYAKNQYKIADYKYNAVGDPDTDHPGNDTSSLQPGFFSNDEAIAEWQYGDKDLAEFPNPVVQVNGIVNIQLKKIDGSSSQALAGANFDLYLEVPAGTEGSITYTDGNGIVHSIQKINTESLVSTSSAVIEVNGLFAGTYYLFETKAPDGYVRLDHPITFDVTTNKITLHTGETGAQVNTTEPLLLNVKNFSSYRFPETGGTGAKSIYVIGALLMFGALTIGCILWRRREGRGEM